MSSYFREGLYNSFFKKRACFFYPSEYYLEDVIQMLSFVPLLPEKKKKREETEEVWVLQNLRILVYLGAIFKIELHHVAKNKGIFLSSHNAKTTIGKWRRVDAVQLTNLALRLYQTASGKLLLFVKPGRLYHSNLSLYFDHLALPVANRKNRAKIEQVSLIFGKAQISS